MKKIYHTTLCVRSRNTHFSPTRRKDGFSQVEKYEQKLSLWTHSRNNFHREIHDSVRGTRPRSPLSFCYGCYVCPFSPRGKCDTLLLRSRAWFNWILQNTVFSEILLNFQTEDTNHPSPKLISYTRCGEAFRNETIIGEIQSHNAACKIRVPKFVSICRLCGKVCTCAGGKKRWHTN